MAKLSDDYYIIRCAYRMVTKLEIADAALLLRNWLIMKQEQMEK